MRGEATVSYLVTSMTPLIAENTRGRTVIGLDTTVACGLLPGMLRYMTKGLRMINLPMLP